MKRARHNPSDDGVERSYKSARRMTELPWWRPWGRYYLGPEWVPYELWAIVADFERFPDGACAAKVLIESPGAQELWANILATYAGAEAIARSLPHTCGEALRSWDRLPKTSRAEHTKHLSSLADSAATLARAFDEEIGPWSLMGLKTVAEKDEKDRVAKRVEAGDLVRAYYLCNRILEDRGVPTLTFEEYNAYENLSRTTPIVPEQVTESLDRSFGNRWPKPEPKISDVLLRIASILTYRSMYHPLARPKFRNAKRNYFTRMVISHFREQPEPVSPTIVASIVSMFFPGGISENEVSQLLRERGDVKQWPDPKELDRHLRKVSSK